MDEGGWLPGLDLLALLAIRKLEGRAAYGLSVRAELECQSGLCIRHSDAYLALDRLVEKGLVVSRLGAPTPTRGGHARRYFAMTPAGLEVLDVCARALGGLSAMEETSG